MSGVLRSDFHPPRGAGHHHRHGLSTNRCGGGGGGGADAWPTLPDASTPAPPGGCAWLPTYGFNNVASGGWFALPASGSAIRFDALDTTRFTAITGFPAGTTWVDVDGQSHGPFTSGQSFSFADQPGGSVTTFTVRADAGQIPALTGFQLAFAADPWSLTHGTYEAVLTVSTDKNGTVVHHSDSLTIEVLASAPVLSALNPAAAYAGGEGFKLIVTGGCFQLGAVVHWNGSPRPTTVDNGSRHTASVPASDLQAGATPAIAAVRVVNGDGQVSDPLGFSIVPRTVGTADAVVAPPGTGASVSTAPTTAGEPGVSVTVNNGGTEPVDVQVSGANPSVTATVCF